METIITAVTTAVFSGVILLLIEFFVTPRLERNKTVQQELWKSKRDVFVCAIQLVDKQLASASWTGPDVPKDYVPSKEKPTGREINEVFSLLLLHADNKDIVKIFKSVFIQEISPAGRGEFLHLLREELFSSKVKFNPEEIPYFF